MAEEHNQNQNDQSEQSLNTHESATELKACLIEVEAWKEKFLRSNADFQNFKRRTEKEQAVWMQSAQSDVFKALLPIIDDMDRAIAESRKTLTPEMQSWLTGFEMINASCYKLLKKFNVEEITDLAVFNPVLHEALASVEVPGKQSGEIVDVLQKGFTIKGEVLRPTKVAVAK